MLRSAAFGSILSASVLVLMSVSAASAVTVSYVSAANECGEGGFDACTYDGSPTIIKFGGRGFSLDEINGLFPSIDGSEFEFTVTEKKDGVEPIAGTWKYTPGAGDPAITAYAVKAGKGYNLFTNLTPDEALGGGWYTPDRKGISHITFFDTGMSPVPLPAGGLLLLGALGALGLMRRRKTA